MVIVQKIIFLFFRVIVLNNMIDKFYLLEGKTRLHSK